MGGFAFEIQDGPGNFFPAQGQKGDRRTRLTLTSDGLLWLAESHPELIPELTRERIQDKSKGSMLAKSLVCFQGQLASPEIKGKPHIANTLRTHQMRDL